MNIDERKLRIVVKTAFVLLIALFFIPSITVSCGSDAFPHSMMDIARGGSSEIRKLVGGSQDVEGNYYIFLMLLLPVIGAAIQFLPKTEMYIDEKTQGILSAVLFGVNMVLWIAVFVHMKQELISEEAGEWITVKTRAAYWISMLVHTAGILSSMMCLHLPVFDNFMESVQRSLGSSAVPGRVKTGLQFDPRIIPLDLERIKNKLSVPGLNQTWRCIECGKMMRSDALYCSVCGTKRPEEKRDRYCSNCGQMIKEGDVFCGGCGKPLGNFQRKTHPTEYGQHDAII